MIQPVAGSTPGSAAAKAAGTWGIWKVPQAATRNAAAAARRRFMQGCPGSGGLAAPTWEVPSLDDPAAPVKRPGQDAIRRGGRGRGLVVAEVVSVVVPVAVAVVRLAVDGVGVGHRGVVPVLDGRGILADRHGRHGGFHGGPGAGERRAGGVFGAAAGRARGDEQAEDDPTGGTLHVRFLLGAWDRAARRERADAH